MLNLNTLMCSIQVCKCFAENWQISHLKVELPFLITSLYIVFGEGTTTEGSNRSPCGWCAVFVASWTGAGICAGGADVAGALNGAGMETVETEPDAALVAEGRGLTTPTAPPTPFLVERSGWARSK